MFKRFDVITFGSATVDMFLETGLPEKGKFMAYPVGSKIMLKNIRFDIGGGGTNTAVAFARFGFRTGYIGKVDSGFGGRQILELLKQEKVAFLGGIEKDSKIPGGYSAILDSKENDRTILSYKGINETITYKDIKKGKAKSRWLYLSSFLGVSFETQKFFAKEMHNKGVRIAFNPSDYLIEKKNLKDLLRITDVLILNKEEGQMLAKTKGKDLLPALRELGPKIVVVTDKNKETFAYDGERKYSIVPHDIKVVERTGAGDAFAAGFVSGIMAGMTINESLKLALQESESVIKHFGAKNNLLRRSLK
jgi:ribokinase